MITVLINRHHDECIRVSIETMLLNHVRMHGPIVSLDKFAWENNITPCWVRICAHRAARKGLVKLTRLSDQCGRPYRVSALEEETP